MYAEEYHRQPEPVEGVVAVQEQVWQSPLEVPRNWHDIPNQFATLWTTLHMLVLNSQNTGVPCLPLIRSELAETILNRGTNLA
jgi:hypothetical protein